MTIKSTKERADGEAGAVLFCGIAVTEGANMLLGWGLAPLDIIFAPMLAAIFIYAAALFAGKAWTVGQMGEIEQIGYEDRQRDNRNPPVNLTDDDWAAS